MRLFSKKINMVRTDSNLKPSERFEIVLFQKLEKEGFRYFKSKNEFVQDFEYGKRIITLSYNNSFGYISTVQYFIKIVFTDLEKIFKKVYPDYGWTNWTIHKNLHWTDGILYNNKSEGYTDKSINKLADEFFRIIKPQINLTFSKICDYQELNKVYNSNPQDFIDYLPPSRLEKRIINGLILIKSIEPENFHIKQHQFLMLLDKYKGNDIKDIRIEVGNGIKILNEQDIKLTLPPTTYKNNA